ncbi:DUF2514 family protein [Pigmentiphaga kullae]|uniref:Uncharacterized protein DUF2514 n=1 Tax=Pigmentiphaga kullae TaxID=151784 RepID=A0A4Q7NCI6_9BURK|nr:DUF2514 family protein [Pigmentiphaga kullae]RZS80665.1 uncharacterized protein DUF2514 [Pigmentiphaga kullae]
MNLMPLIPPWARYGAVAAIAAVATWYGPAQVQKTRLEARIATIQGDRQAELQAASDAAYRASEAYRQLELAKQGEVENERKESRAREARYADAAAGARAERDRLRQQLAAADAVARGGAAAAAAGAGPGLDGSAVGAAVLRFVVGECVDRYIDVASEADRLAARLMGLQGYVQAITN